MPFAGWTDENVSRLREMHAEGFSSTLIGRALGCTRSMIIGKARRLKLPEKVLTTVVERRQPYRKSGPRRVRTIAPPEHLAGKPKPPARIKCEPVAIEELQHWHCRWPLWENATPQSERRYCGAPKDGPLSYCAACAAIAYENAAVAKARRARQAARDRGAMMRGRVGLDAVLV